MKLLYNAQAIEEKMTKPKEELYVFDGNKLYHLEDIIRELDYIQQVVSRVTSCFTIADLDKFLKTVYSAQVIDLEDINSCANRGIKRYNQYCNTPACLSEEMVANEDYIATYKILRQNVGANENMGSCYRETVVIVGSQDRVHPNQFYIGGGSKRLGLQMNIMCGKIELKLWE